MATLTNPSDIAREALRLLATRRTAPTPDNYRDLYYEIAGTPAAQQEPFPERQIKSLLANLKRGSAEQAKLCRQLEQALAGSDWDELKAALTAFINGQEGGKEQPWGELIADLLRQWETRHAGLTPARKRESVDHVLSSTGNDNHTLFSRLQSLTRSWSHNPEAAADLPLVNAVDAAAEVTATADNVSPAQENKLFAELRELFAQTLETVVATQLVTMPQLASDAHALAGDIRQAKTPKALEALPGKLKKFTFRLELLADDQAELRGGLLHLLELVIENISELVTDDKWLHGQMEIVRDIVGQPLNLRSIDDAERRLKEVIYKQSQLKDSLNEAKQALKDMLAGFVDHLADFATSTSDYHDKMGGYAHKISAANDISELGEVIRNVIRDTQVIQLNAQRSRDELQATRLRVDVAERRIAELQSELDQASSLVRNDQLTGVLNRRGFDEAVVKESARALRRQSPLCLCLLDIDNFKKLNDSLGHQVGDAALVHLAKVVRDTMRPQDSIARYGGEEFVILLPDTPLEDATAAIVRLQRELTKKFFMHNNERLLITFSAGVTEYQQHEDEAAILKRADEAMYSAKKSGKNRVVTA
jgi:diguanylate cyclase